MKNFLPDRHPEDRLRILQDSADSTEDTTYFRDLTTEEIEVRNESYVLNAIELSKHDEVLDIAKAEFKAAAKPIKETNEVLMAEIRTRKASVTGTLYHLADHETGIMNTYDEQGEFISSRRMRPGERVQTKIFAVKSANE